MKGWTRGRAISAAAACVFALGAIAGAAVLLLSRQKPAATPNVAAAPSASDRPLPPSDFVPLPECGCGPWKVSWRAARQGEDPTMEPGHRDYLVPEFKLERGDRNWVVKPGGDAALPQRIYVPRVRLGVACDDDVLVVAGAHWASAYGIGVQRWTRRIDADPAQPNHVLRVVDSIPGNEPLRVASAQPRLGSTTPSIACAPLDVDRGHVRIADIGGNAGWYELRLGMKKD